MATLTEVAVPTLTYEAYMAEPEVQGRYDIVNGIRVFQPELSWKRQRIIGNLSEAMLGYRRTHGAHAFISPFDLLIRRDPLQIRQSDILLISHDRLMQDGGPPKIGPLEIGPEVVVEIVMGSEMGHGLWDKITDYISIGVDECWVVRPETRTVEVLTLTPGEAQSVRVYGDGEAVASVVFPDLSVPVTDVFTP